MEAARRYFNLHQDATPTEHMVQLVKQAHGADANATARWGGHKLAEAEALRVIGKMMSLS